jgi:hypothetical protein
VTDRERRIAENESRFREINERLEADLRRLPDDGEPVGYVCECGRAGCAELVQLSRAEYERVRGDSQTFLILPGHEFPDAEDVVAGAERFMVVRKKAPTRRSSSGPTRGLGLGLGRRASGSRGSAGAGAWSTCSVVCSMPKRSPTSCCSSRRRRGSRRRARRSRARRRRGSRR